MATALQGKSLMLFFRDYSKRTTEDAAKLRFQTEHSIKLEKESTSTATKDGNINSVSDGAASADIKSVAYKEDGGTVEVWKTLRKNFKENKLMELWQVDLSSKNESGEYDVEYYQGYFTAFELSAPSDDKVELSTTFAINGNGIEGTDTLTETQSKAVASAIYEYKKLAGVEDNK